jgi:hypothetical protein
MFKSLADRGINIQAISTSEIKVSVLIDADEVELAVRLLHTAYGLDGAKLSDARGTVTASGLLLSRRFCEKPVPTFSRDAQNPRQAHVRLPKGFASGCPARAVWNLALPRA